MVPKSLPHLIFFGGGIVCLVRFVCYVIFIDAGSFLHLLVNCINIFKLCILFFLLCLRGLRHNGNA